MVVFLSDIHFSDDTAGPPNVPASAFKGTFDEIGEMAEKAQAKQLDIVFLGDVFDLIRTTAWQDFAQADRPWGLTDGEWTTEQNAATLKVLQGVVDINQDALKVLAGSPHPNTVKTYIPGNHDRMLNFTPELRSQVVSLLGMNWDPAERFSHYYFNESARTFARHGHEFDSFNFAGSKTFDHQVWTDIPQSDYDKTPIGDLLAAEVSARLPDEIMHLLPGGRKSYPELWDRLRDLFDVRPTAAMLTFLSYQIHNFNDPAVEHAINQGVHNVVTTFRSLDFVKRWIDENKRWYNPCDKADVLELVLFLGERINLKELEVISKGYQFFNKSQENDNLASSASADFQRLDHSPEFGDKSVEFILYGHTHCPEQRLITTVGKGADVRPRMYLNTGMWRPMHNQGLLGGFGSWDTLCYSVIYEPGELYKGGATCKRPMFEVWTGGLERD